MKQKLLILILFITLFLPIGLCDKIENNINNIDNIKIYDDKEKLISIYDKNNDKSMDIKLIYTSFDINKMIKIVEITNYVEYIPNEKQDFITKTKKIYGNDIYKSEYYIEKYNYNNISIRKEIYNNKTKQNETIIINKIVIDNSYWIEYKPYNKKILKNETFKLKIIHYKKPELGFFKIQTIPIFKNIECKEFTWWLGNWDLKRPILINNTMGDNVTDYQLKSINLSVYQINASSIRIINETSGLQLNYWNESVNSIGNLEYIWVNFSEINNGSWINDTYYIYYQSSLNVNSVSNITNTFLFGDDFINSSLDITKWTLTGNINIINSEIILNQDDQIVSINTFGLKTITTSKSKANEQDIHFIKMIDSGGTNEQSFTNTDYVYPNDFNKFRHHSVKNGAYDNLYIDNWDDFRNVYKQYSIERISNSKTIFRQNNNFLIFTITSQIPIVNLSVGLYVWDSSQSSDLICDWIFVRKYTKNEPELLTVGNIEYPEDIEMNCSINIITHLTEKQIKTTYTNGSIINESLSNIKINLPYDSYIIYMSNPVKITTITNLFNTMDNILIQFFLFVLIIVISIVFILFLNIIKNKGFKGVTK